MTLYEIINLVKSEEYEFLRVDRHLGKNMILLALGGSYAYGTNTIGSDLDVRGCALNSKSEILLGNQLGMATDNTFKEFNDRKTNTVIYSFNKLIPLLSNSNPNIIEMLGCNPKHYLVSAFQTLNH